MRRARSRKGQIVIPALFIFPTLMMFVFLLFETAKLSREKIRHQFAVDAAAFVEMTNYSDFLNRSAYVNGAFPMRIFREGFHDTMMDCLGRDPCPGKKPLDELLYEDGVFPRSISQPDRTEFTQELSWDIGYGGPRAGMNSEEPQVGSPDCVFTGKKEKDSAAPIPTGGDAGCLTLISMNTAKFWNINWDDANQVYKLYVQIYQLLGSVESAQFSVLKRLAAQHNFLKKSYWLNTGGEQALAEAGALVGSFDKSASGFSSSVKFHCVQNVLFHGNQLVSSWMQPYQIWASDPPPQLPNTIQECAGLYQLATVGRSMVESMSKPVGSSYPGWPVEVAWQAPAQNYFNVPVNNLLMNADRGPRVRATVSVWRGPNRGASVWPNPTPKFQVRLYP